MGEPGVGRMRNRLLLDSGIYRNPFEIFGVDRPGAVGHREALLQQSGDLLLTQPLAPARERRAIKWQLVPEHHFPTEVLEIRVLHPSLAQRLVREVASWRSSRGWLIGLPPTANLAVEGITDHPNRESQTAIKPACTPGFLAKSIPCSGQIIAINQSVPNSSRTTR